MDLFASSGIDLPHGGARKPGAVRTLKLPLFAYKVVQAALDRDRAAFSPTPAQLKLARDYARNARDGFKRANETQVRPRLIRDVLIGLLGYTPLDTQSDYTLEEERPIARGKVDVALGRFQPGGRGEIVAPLELKGPKTRDLDAPMPGRGRSAVQQAWDYASDLRGARWVLVSNCLEIRLYGFGRGREAYESFDLGRLDDAGEHERLHALLHADRLLSGRLDDLLRDTDAAYRDVTDELYKQYSALRDRLIAYLVNGEDGPRLRELDAIEPAQKILDRILFIAFAQRTDLLPKGLLERAAKARNEFSPQPLWANFATLFRAVDVGDKRLDVWPYNGGLFAPDPILDKVTLPDDLAGEVASLGHWDFKSEVPVTLLGHIFEQSVTDIERLKASASGRPDPSVTKRKREGVVYTPDMVTRFIVEKTIGAALAETFEALRARHPFEAGEASQIALWRGYGAALRNFTVVDLACGSGAFLVAAYDALIGEYARTQKALAELGEEIAFDAADEILSRNLYGVDLNPESVEITRLSLWLKTARREHKLANLESTIRVGDSLIEDAAYTLRPFDWRAAFPEVFARGGFDVVVGNPPYVRMEFIKSFKPYLAERYKVASDRADLYAYFFERGLQVLKPAGRLGFIASSTFFRTGSGEPLRRLLVETTALETIVDFGDAQIFEGVTTYPAILSMRKGEPTPGDLAYLTISGDPPADLSAAFEAGAKPMPRTRLTSDSWRVEPDALAALREKIRAGRKTLGEVYGAPMRGIVTGLNEAFVIDTATRDRLVARDPRSAELLKPFLRGENVKRWRVEPEGLWLINTPKGMVDIEAYPAVRDWLLPFKPELEKRATKQEWWELQQAQLAYQPSFDAPKIVYQDIAATNPFSMDIRKFHLANTCYFIASNEFSLPSLLNSRLTWFVLLALTNIARGGYLRLRSDFVEKIPIPDTPPADRARLAALAQTCTGAARARYDVQSQVRRRLLDLAPPERARLNTRLNDWHDLDFAALRAEIKKQFRADIPVRERAEWEAYLAENAARAKTLSLEIAAAEREIDALVYRLFDLTPEEIALLEASLEKQY
jgi:hypothetical protein